MCYILLALLELLQNVYQWVGDDILVCGEQPVAKNLTVISWDNLNYASFTHVVYVP